MRVSLQLPLVAWAVVALAPAPAAAADPPAAEAIDFARDVRPILMGRCSACHGPEHHESGLRLDRRDAALAGGDSGPVIVAAKSDESELIRRVTSTDDSERMPPADAGEPLTAEQVATLRAWIDAGASWPASADAADAAAAPHWSYQPVARPEPPQVAGASRVANPIDRFVLATLEAQGIAPSPEADRPTLIKRLYYDLIGLPPEPAAVDAFVLDDRPDAYSILVEQLLASPHFGERWGRHWLDKARYADSDGYEKDNARPDAWRWRDWVIDAVNRDLPLDEFTIEQLAGDLLPGATADQLLATAFNRQTLTNTEGGADQEQFRVEALFDRVNTLGAVWLGLTVGCAQCHSHKYDQISHQEYYQFLAFFDNADETNAEAPISDAAVAEYEVARSVHERRAAELARQWDALRARVAARESAAEAQLVAQLAEASQQPLELVPLEVLEIASSGGVTYDRLDDGSYLARGENPARETVTLRVALPPGSTSTLRLEALAHDEIPAKGPGRAGHGNFVLHELRVQPLDAADAKPGKPLKFARARATFSQDGFDVTGAVDGNDKTGWAIAPELGRDQHATFDLAEPTPGTLRYARIELRQKHGLEHTLGRFRISALRGIDPESIAPATICEVLAVSAAERTPAQRESLIDYFAAHDPRGSALKAEIEAHQRAAPARPFMSVRVLRERSKDLRVTHILRRGDFLQPGDEVRPGTLASLPAIEPRTAGAAPDRLDLARWLVRPDHPLVSRVMVNQVWEQLFGAGLVDTPNDFGVRGSPPTHPELLDWLAHALVDEGWSRKQLIRAIVGSATYRQASAHRGDLDEVDPQNKLLARQNRLRVEGEVVRDLYLAASGLLVRTVGGRSVFPPMPDHIAKLSYSDNFSWKNSAGADRYRRGMYTFFKRTAPHPNLATFDCPDANTTCIERRTSNTPLQALATLNETAFFEAAQALARRAWTEAAADERARLTYAMRLCVARAPAPGEIDQAASLLAEARAWYETHPDDAAKLIGDYAPKSASAADAAAWVATCRVFLNLDEFVTRE